MEKQTEKETKPTNEPEQGKGSTEEVPFNKDSPYLKYDNLEDYKKQGYGTEGHQQPTEGRGAGSTEAPTPSGADVSSEAEFKAAEAVNHK
ncbi:uncharacterized protein LOC131607246 [Vicia villosa]|uniref:uncharacterized protein LOC131607246 n=1 Tax=Vicia villosa TaxID=3911 RepID=UPI00273B261D|nr:uncharacterized protein LOC131607246 [Vicia villosa]